MSKKVWVISILIVLVVIFGIWFFMFRGAVEEDNSPLVSITYDNFIEQVSKQSLVKSIPSEGKIGLEFYGDDGEAVKKYTLKRAQVIEGSEGGEDIFIRISDKYIKTLTNKNFCDVIAQAKSAGELGIDTSMSSSALAWKYKSMLSYKDCLGI